MTNRTNMVTRSLLAATYCLVSLIAVGCGNNGKPTESETPSVPHQGRWGIYALSLVSQEVALLYSSNDEIVGINLSNTGSYLVFSTKTLVGVDLDTTSEISILNISSGQLTRLTNNFYFDSYPSFSPDDSQIVFLSLRDSTIDLYKMNSDGTDQRMLYNSGGHDADADWGSAGRIAFTRDYQIWSVNSDGTNPQRVTNPADAGVWGIANLPIGDYDPRISPDGSKITFERMVDVSFVHGGYDIFVTGATGTGEINLTNNGSQGYAQGFANWSHSGTRLVYIVSAIDTVGKFDLYMMNTDGSEINNITPGYFPATFLCHNAVFSLDDTQIYFVGQWWQP